MTDDEPESAVLRRHHRSDHGVPTRKLAANVAWSFPCVACCTHPDDAKAALGHLLDQIASGDVTTVRQAVVTVRDHLVVRNLYLPGRDQP